MVTGIGGLATAKNTEIKPQYDSSHDDRTTRQQLTWLLSLIRDLLQKLVTVYPLECISAAPVSS